MLILLAIFVVSNEGEGILEPGDSQEREGPNRGVRGARDFRGDDEEGPRERLFRNRRPLPNAFRRALPEVEVPGA
jgi:hypothetical protein